MLAILQGHNIMNPFGYQNKMRRGQPYKTEKAVEKQAEKNMSYNRFLLRHLNNAVYAKPIFQVLVDQQKLLKVLYARFEVVNSKILKNKKVLNQLA